jgi:hypothetical protein
MQPCRVLIFFCVLFISSFVFSVTVSGFGVLTHEAIIDASWDQSIKPLLKKKFPNATEADLKEAHAYVFGGSIIPDIGYHPFGSILFTHLFHYVRTGDFIEALINESDSLNDYAFALGALCHYIADSYGHPLGTNHVVPLVFPKVREKYGDVVNYEQAPLKHIRVEYGFDVLQTAKGKYDKDEYHNFVDFKMRDSLLEKAFFKTYGLHIKDVFNSYSISVSSFRFTVKSLIPEMTRDAWKARKSAIIKLSPLATEENFYYKIDRKSYKREYKTKFNLKSTFITVIIGVLPKWGPLAMFRFKEPTEEGEKIYDQTFATVVAKYNAAVKKLAAGDPSFQNVDLDTGNKIARDEYKLTNKTYEKLLIKLKKKNFENADESLKKDILSFYDHKKVPSKLEEDDKEKEDHKVKEALDELRASLSANMK